jgi:LPS export ABC transporter protein LptC
MKTLFFLFLTLLLIACSSEQPADNIPAITQEFPDQESWNTTMVITREGKTIGHLRSGHIRKYVKKNYTLLSDSLQVDFYNEKGEHTSVLRSQGGKVIDNSQDMLAYGHVVVVSDSGITLYSDTLNWDNKNQKIYSEIPVRLIRAGTDTLYGDRFISDRHLSNYEVINPHGKSAKMIRLED